MRIIASALVAVACFGADPSFFRDIKPILQRPCQGCHQPNLKSSNLDLTTFEALKRRQARAGDSAACEICHGRDEAADADRAAAAPRRRYSCRPDWVAAGAKDDTPAEAETSPR